MRKLWKLLGTSLFWISWPIASIQLKNTHRTRVLLVSPNNKILLVRSWYGSTEWGLPGGGIKDHETPTEAAIREVSEEVNINIKTDALTFLYDDDVKKFGIAYHGYYFFGLLKNAPKVSLQFPEIFDAQWFSEKELSGVNINPDVLMAIRAWSDIVQ